MLSASTAEITASGWTLVNSAILRRSSSGICDRGLVFRFQLHRAMHLVQLAQGFAALADIERGHGRRDAGADI
ncbi:MAG: hypothetical protein HZC24_00765, partial [Rhodocyclales bacterium]|nr:hypothetical protein [Rhodocyclales bacterium]